MAAPIIQVEHLGKRYVLQHRTARNYVALRDVLTDKFRSLFRSGTLRTDKEEFRALDDVSFSVEAGDRLGIIGRNGAGKSTLLKVLSRITEPSAGRVTIDGRVASLLEVGTGFHPELTGRENIFLNGSILGMSRAEITAKFDEIVAFAEVERFLDTPVKRYSSGMYVRLAFAVAAHLEPEILIVDEVLAVGDAAFQRKCLGKMEDVSGQGRTVLFVSHNMEAVQRLCNKGLLLHKGKLEASGTMGQVVDQYLLSNAQGEGRFTIQEPESHSKMPGVVEEISILDGHGKPNGEIPVGGPWEVAARFRMNRDQQGVVVGCGLVSALGMPLRTVWTSPQDLREGRHEARFTMGDIRFAPGLYHLVIGLSSDGNTFHYVNDQATFMISEASDIPGDPRLVNSRSGLILDQGEAEVKRL